MLPDVPLTLIFTAFLAYQLVNEGVVISMTKFLSQVLFNRESSWNSKMCCLLNDKVGFTWRRCT